MGKLDQDNFCSLFVAVDDFYLDKLLLTYPTWVACHPELIRMPHVFVVDELQVHARDPRWAVIARAREAAAAKEGISLRDTRFSVVPWSMDHAKGISQREEMLTGLIRCAKALTTPWYLKLDADTYATERKGFYYDSWFKDDVVYIAPPWGYTKPAGTVSKMNAWATGVPELAGFPEVPSKQVDLGGGKTKDVHHRMASWTMFSSTKWTTWASGLCKEDRLPFPSQDTYLSYIQARTGAKWIPMNFRKMGLEHCRNIDGLREACRDTLEKIGATSAPRPPG